MLIGVLLTEKCADVAKKFIQLKRFLYHAIVRQAQFLLAFAEQLVWCAAEQDGSCCCCRVKHQEVNHLPADVGLLGADVQDDEVGLLLFDAFVGHLTDVEQQGIEISLTAQDVVKETHEDSLVIDDSNKWALTRHGHLPQQCFKNQCGLDHTSSYHRYAHALPEDYLTYLLSSICNPCTIAR
jgi:hypothetical protein